MRPYRTYRVSVFSALFLYAIASFSSESQQAVATAPGALAFNAGRDINLGPVEIAGAKIAITKAYLVPSFNMFEKKWVEPLKGENDGFYDSAFLCVEVTNISSQPLLVTAVKLDVANAKNFKWGPGTNGEGCPSEKISNVSPRCYFQPAERKKWLIPRGFKIRGLIKYLETIPEDTYIFNDMLPARTNDDLVVRNFNAFLRSTVGTDATLELTLFERDYVPLLRGRFQIADGKDLFETEGRRRASKSHLAVYPLQHDALLGEGLEQLRSQNPNTIFDTCNDSDSKAKKNKKQ